MKSRIHYNLTPTHPIFFYIAVHFLFQLHSLKTSEHDVCFICLTSCSRLFCSNENVKIDGEFNIWSYEKSSLAMRSHVALARTKSTDASISLCWWWLQFMASVEIDMWTLNWWTCCCLILWFSSYSAWLTLPKFIYLNKYPLTIRS